jgi:putative tryptophan/tyrosine transport system substrate-binding protein
MRRREFIGLIGGAVAWPLARAEQAGGVRRVGVLMVESDPLGQSYLKSFVQKLQELGWTDGRNVHSRFTRLAPMLSVSKNLPKSWSRGSPT